MSGLNYRHESASIRGYLSALIPSNSHDVIAAIHVNNFARDCRSHRAAEEQNRVADFAGFDVATERGTLGRVLQHGTEVRYAARRERLNWTGADSVDANVARAKIICQITCACFQRRLCYPHTVVTGDTFFRAVVTHANNAAAFGHQRRRGTRKLNQ